MAFRAHLTIRLNHECLHRVPFCSKQRKERAPSRTLVSNRQCFDMLHRS